MKTITKFLTLVLSLFCVFGLISPVYAEESEDTPTFKAYHAWNGSEEITSKDTDAYDYTLAVGTWYGFSFNWDGNLNSSGQSRLDKFSATGYFETDKFSTYAIMYTDTVKASKTPSTSDTTTVGLYGGVAVISVLAVGLLFFFKKRNA